MEVWKDIVGYEGKYQVSNLGRVKSLNYLHTGKEKIMDGGVTVHQYKNRIYKQRLVTLCKNGKQKHYYIHHLVYESFNGKIHDGYEIDHIDNNPENNIPENLQLLTRSENQKKKFIDNPDLEVGNKKRMVLCLETRQLFNSTRECARKLKINNSNLVQHLKGKRPSCGGYSFIYFNNGDN